MLTQAPLAASERLLVPACFSDPWDFAPKSAWFWHDASTGLRFAAWGGGRLLRAPLERRFERAQASCSSAIEQWRGSACEGLPAALLAFSFDERISNVDRTWRNWPRTWLWIPRFIAFSWPGCVPERGILVQTGSARPPAALPLRVAMRPAGQRRVELPGEKERYLRDVRRIVNDIAQRRLHKVVLARRAEVRSDEDARFDVQSTLRALRGAVCFGLARGDAMFMGATPEVLARVEDGALHTHALAGTASRGGDVLGSDKNVHEHRLVLEALVDRLEALCTGVEVARPRVTCTRDVEHIDVGLRGRLRSGVGLLGAAAAMHPTPALAGAPTDAALAWLRANEPFDRGYYGGLVGWLAPSGDGVLAVGIRSALVTQQRALLFAGAGIVAGSEADAEWRETESKLGTMLAALRAVPTLAEEEP